jgi:type III secretion system FlhB-like substrate exporter
MKYTRKEILIKSLTASAYILSASSPLLTHLLKTKQLPANDLTTKLKQSEIPDVIILNDSSPRNFDFVALKYNREVNDAPCIVFMNSADKKSYVTEEYKNNLTLLKTYAQKNNVELYYGYGEDNKNSPSTSRLIKEIKKCGKDYEISEDLYRGVSFVYAELYRRENRLLC